MFFMTSYFHICVYFCATINYSLAKKAVQLVFHHRKTPLKKLPVSFGKDAFETLEKNWTSYQRKIKAKKGSLKLPESIEEVISVLNQWLEENAFS